MKPDNRAPIVVPSDAPVIDGAVCNVSGNHFDKHNCANPVVRRLMARFHRDLLAQVGYFDPKTVLDAGCGEGRTSALVSRSLGVRMVGIELERAALAEAPIVDEVSFVRGSVYELPFETGSVDVVMCTEVLEHLDDPDAALRELVRVARDGVVVTVPREPWWRAANMARGSYLGEFGNTPGHVQHFTKRGLAELLAGQPIRWYVLGHSTLWRVARLEI